jgi:tetratricopeptide (TPR) repeat protein
MAKPKTPRPSEPDPEEQLRRWAALEWFDQGQALSDNSEEELGFYRRALEVFPGFAPAAYFMGVIYLEWGDRETALRAFRRFLRYATPEELQRYPLPETITPEELENVPSPPQ